MIAVVVILLSLSCSCSCVTKGVKSKGTETAPITDSVGVFIPTHPPVVIPHPWNE